MNKMNINDYLAFAEDEFSSFDGWEDDSDMGGGYPYDMDFDGSEDEMWEEDYASAAGGDVSSRTSPSPYQISIQNTTAGVLTAVIFGRNQFLLSANFGSPVGIIITPSQSNISYVELLQQSAEQPFETSLLRVQSTNTAQITQIINVVTKDANGQEATVPVITQSYFSANQFQAGILDVPYSAKIDANTRFDYPVLGNTTVILTFFPSEKVNPARTLLKRGAVKQYAAPTVPVITPVYPKSYPKPVFRRRRPRRRIVG